MIIHKDNINDFAEIFGLILGDGWLSKSNRQHKNGNYIVYQSGVSADIEDLISVKNKMTHIFNDIGKASIRTTDTHSKEYNINGITNMVVFNKKVSTTLEEYGMPVGKRIEKNFSIPEWIVNGSLEIKRYFISGLYAAEGDILNFQKNNKTLKSPSIVLTKRKSLENDFKEMCNQIKNIFGCLGVEMNIHYSYKTSLKHENIYANFSICNSNQNIKKFIELLPLNYCKRKKDVFEKVYDYISYKEKEEEKARLTYLNVMKDSKKFKICQIAKKYNIPWSTANNYIKGTRTNPMSIRFLTFDEYSSIKNPLNGGNLIT